MWKNKTKRNEHRKLRTQNTTLPISWLEPNVAAKPSDKSSQLSFSLPYDTSENVHDSNACSTRKLSVAKPIAAVSDRVSNQKR